ncbi:transposase, partial [Escherichia coli]
METSFGALKRIGVECTGTYGSGLLRYLQNAGLEVLEVTAPDRMERRKRGKSDTIDAECAAHAAFSGISTVTPKTSNGMIESLRALKTCRKTAISARRVALQIIHSNIISAPDKLREQLRNMTRMQLIRTLGSWRPDASEYRNVTSVYRISLKSLARRYLELHDEIADLDVMIAAIVDELAPELIKRNSIGYESSSQLLITAGDNPQRLRSESGLRHCVVSALFPYFQKKRIVKDVCREAGISEATYYNWKSRYGGMETSDIKKIKDL